MKPTSFLARVALLLLSHGVLIPVAVAGESTIPDPVLREPVRGVWVANVASTTMSSIEGINEFVDLADRCGINTLYVVVWNRGMTTYPSEIMRQESGQACDPRYEQFDVLRAIIKAAHAKGVRVIAWFEFGFSCSYRKPDGGWLIRKHPDWAALDLEGNLVSKNGFQWMNGFRPEVQDFVLSLLKEILPQL